MKNPLSLEQRVLVARLLDHDSSTVRAILTDSVLFRIKGRDALVAPQTEYSLNLHTNRIEEAVAILTKESYPVADRLDKDRFNHLFKDMAAVFKELYSFDLVFSTSMDREITSYQAILYTALFNLAKNSREALRGQQDGKIVISAEPYTKGMVFSVTDNGCGFPPGIPPQEFFELGRTTKGEGKGFGLTYASLASKYLNATLAVESAPGNTRISIRHPFGTHGF